MKKVISFIVVITMFLLVASVETVEITSQVDIQSAQIQAQINRESRCE